MDIYIGSGVAFYKEEGEIFYLEAIFAVLRNNIEDLIKEKIENKNYGDGIKSLNIILICEPYREEEEYFKYWGSEGTSHTVMDARKFIDGTFVERVDMMVNDIGRTVKEFYKLMKSRKDKREFNIDEFLKDLEDVKRQMFRKKEELKKQVDERVIREITRDNGRFIK